MTVCAQCSECQRELIQKARVNGGRNYDSLKHTETRKAAASGHRAAGGGGGRLKIYLRINRINGEQFNLKHSNEVFAACPLFYSSFAS